MTPLQQERLDAACKALEAAGAEKLPLWLREAFEAQDLDGVNALLGQARVFASYCFGRRAAARDALGLLWAVVEGE